MPAITVIHVRARKRKNVLIVVVVIVVVDALYLKKMGHHPREEFTRRRVVEPNTSESFFREVGRNSLKHQKIYVPVDVAAKIARRGAPPERPWDRRRPSRTIYKPAVPTSSPGLSLSRSPLLSQQLGGSLFTALRLPILYAAPHFKDEFARNFFFFSTSSSSSFYSYSSFHEHPRLAALPSSRRREKLRREKRLRLIEIEFYSSAVHFINAEEKLFCKAFRARCVSTPSSFSASCVNNASGVSAKFALFFSAFVRLFRPLAVGHFRDFPSSAYSDLAKICVADASKCVAFKFYHLIRSAISQIKTSDGIWLLRRK